MSLAHVYTVAFEGMEPREVDVQVHIGPGGGTGSVFNVVGLADKAVGESRERVRAALNAWSSTAQGRAVQALHRSEVRRQTARCRWPLC
jgi:magnesium chelatase family protein